MLSTEKTLIIGNLVRVYILLKEYDGVNFNEKLLIYDDDNDQGRTQTNKLN